MIRFSTLALAAVSLIAVGTPAHAIFPVSGAWTYDNASQPGRATHCGKRVMHFNGMMRYDTETAARNYRNLSASKVGRETWVLVDQFTTNLVVLGQVHYTLRLVDEDHIVIRLDKGGATWMLRRCG